MIFVRAVNVGGTARLPMADFRSMLEELGGKHPRTYIASGNAVLELDASDASGWSTFDRSVERELEVRFGFQRDVVSRSVKEVEGALAEHPFPVTDPKWSYVTFLTAEPQPENLASASELPPSDAEWTVLGAHLHIRYPEGMSATTLNADALFKRLGVTGTARNLRTVRAILDLAQG
ncbi:MAG: DUF1697 domain-containing protein [Terrimesophilobacter sp.]